MGLNVVYVSPTGGGTATGADASNPAVAISSNAFAAAITGAALNTEIRFLPGRYVTNTAISFTNSFTRALPLYLRGCDSSGNPIVVSRGSNGLLDTSNFPILETSGNVNLQNTASLRRFITWDSLYIRNIISNTNQNILTVSSENNFINCRFESFTSSFNIRLLYLNGGYNYVANCDFLASGRVAEMVGLAAQPVFFANCVFSGNPNTDYCPAIATSAFRANFINCIFTNIVDSAIQSSDAFSQNIIDHCLFLNVRGHAISNSNTTLSNSVPLISNNVFYNVTGYAVNTAVNLGNVFLLSNNAFFNCGSGFFNNSSGVPTGVYYTSITNDIGTGYRYSPNSVLRNKDMFGKDLGPSFAPQFLAFAGIN